MEGKELIRRWFYHSGIKADPEAAANSDILVIHSYSDGVVTSTGSELAQMWANHTEQFAVPLNKPVWMSETSGYTDIWEKGKDPGTFGMDMDIHSALFCGDTPSRYNIFLTTGGRLNLQPDGRIRYR